MKWFAGLRALALLRAAVRALERFAAAHETLARIAQDTWDEQHKPYVKPTFAQLSMDPELVGEEWKRRKDALLIEEEPEYDPYHG
jgi:hypothetical protein